MMGMASQLICTFPSGKGSAAMRMYAASFGLGLSVTFGAVAAGAQEGGSVSESRDYLRFVEEDGAEGEARLQTAIVSFKNEAGDRVDLVGAVHIADRVYFQALNERFKGYDVVLYELVGGPEALKMKRASVANGSVPEGGGNLAWLGVMQQWMQTKLGLSSQLMEVDYDAPNFVHADMDVEGFLETQKEKKESFLGLWLKAVRAQAELAEADGGGKQQPGLAKILEWMTKEGGADELKRVVGREFDDVEALMAGVEGDGGTVIIGERNRVVIEAIQKELAEGKETVAVFYGAAHLPDLERRLGGIGFVAEQSEWVTAWQIGSVTEGSDKVAN